MKIKLWEQTRIETYAQVVDAFNWCCKNIGPPNEKWKYGRDKPGFLGSEFINGPEEIDFIEFFDEQDAVAFRLTF